MKVRFRTAAYAIPLHRPFATARGVFRVRRGFWIQAVDEDGFVGYGEIAPLPADAPRVVPEIARILSEDPDPTHAARRSAPIRIGVDLAKLDYACRRENRRLAESFTEKPRPAVACNALMRETDPEGAAEEAALSVAHGFETLKLKVGAGSLSSDERRIAAVRAAVGPEIRLRLDANGRWPVETARNALHRFQRYDIEYIEQPVEGDLSVLREAGGIPIAADESVRTIADARRLIARRAVDLIVLKPMVIGIKAADAIAREAITAEIAVVVTSVLDTAVGIAAALHLACSLPGPERAHGLATAGMLEPNAVRGLSVPIRGMMRLPAAPGLGVAVEVPFE